MSEKKLISQPADWWAAFEKQASLEGMTMSQWVGEACKQRCLHACRTTAKAQEVASSFSPRPARGPVKGSSRGQAPR